MTSILPNLHSTKACDRPSASCNPSNTGRKISSLDAAVWHDSGIIDCVADPTVKASITAAGCALRQQPQVGLQSADANNVRLAPSCLGWGGAAFVTTPSLQVAVWPWWWMGVDNLIGALITTPHIPSWRPRPWLERIWTQFDRNSVREEARPLTRPRKGSHGPRARLGSKPTSWLTVPRAVGATLHGATGGRSSGGGGQHAMWW